MAIEHPKDADLAAGIVLTEIIPLTSKSLSPATPPQDKAPSEPINVEGTFSYYLHPFLYHFT